jgi:hypothetical protein
MTEHAQRIRVSCASLCRIEHQGRYLLLLNSNRRGKGIYILSPIGGALAYYNPARLADFDAIPEDPTGSDLRLSLPLDRLDAFRQWFASGHERERSPFRELHEELVTESGLLPALTPDDVDWWHLWTVEEESLTQRQGQTGLLTHYFLEIFGVKFKTAATLGPLLAAPPDTGVAWVTAQQIEARGTLTIDVDGALREARINGMLLLAPPEPPGFPLA